LLPHGRFSAEGAPQNRFLDHESDHQGALADKEFLPFKASGDARPV
jgi:hypothetical protein